MAGRIPQSFIDDLLERADIVEVIDARVSLRKTGRNYTGLCPFHNEKTPSFSVNPDKQFYYCFGCGAGGNALGFLMDYERLDFPQAIEQLAHHLGLEVPREDSADLPRTQQRRDMFGLLDKAANFYQHQLKDHHAADRAEDYLRQRGLSTDIITQFSIGFAPPGWDNLLKHLAHNEADQQLLIDSGMLIQKDNGGCYDRFRDRIMFPIRDHRGRMVAFGGRVLGDDKPKYLNSPETAVFQKNRELYGLYEAKQANRQLNQLLIVEGYMDVVALAQHGISYAAATLGTATNEKHLEKVFRLAPKVVFCFDGDKAGRQAANRALEATLGLMQDGREAAFLFLPEGEDPDSLVRQIGQNAFEQLLQEAQPLSDYLFETSAKGIDISSMDGRARLSQQALPLINRLPAGVFKSLMMQSLAERTGLEQQQLSHLIEDIDHSEANKPASENTAPPYSAEYADPASNADLQPVRRPQLNDAQRQLQWSPTRRAIMLLINYPQLSEQIDPENSLQLDSRDPDFELLKELVSQARAQPNATCYNLLGHWLGTAAGELLAQLLTEEPAINESGAQQELLDCIDHFAKSMQRRNREALIQQLATNRSLTLDQLNDDQKKLLAQIGKPKPS